MPAPGVHFHFLYVAVFMQRCGIIYVSGGSLTLRYKDKENLLTNGCPRNGHGDARCTPARQGWAGVPAARVKVMEMQVGRRPVYGGAPRHPPKIAANATTRGVQGSRGPLVGGRRIETAGRGA